MQLRTTLRTGVGVLAATAGLAAFAMPPAQADPLFIKPMPAHVYAPYFEDWNGDNPATISQESGVKYLDLAFLQTAASGSCTAYWNGDTTAPVAYSYYGSEISQIQASGGDVVAAFGGYGADTTNTDIADSCTSVSAIAAVYEQVITTYRISRIDLDVEATSLTNTAGIERRNEAIVEVEKWAARHGYPVQFEYTIPIATTGLTSTGLAVLQNAQQVGARIAVVNGMAFDYWIGTSQEMATDTETALTGLEGQLQTLHPNEPAWLLWSQIGVTEMQGIDDYGPDETFTLADATTVYDFAKAHGISTVALWAIQRDNGNCVGTTGAGVCSGIAQSPYQFSQIFEPFTRWF